MVLPGNIYQEISTGNIYRKYLQEISTGKSTVRNPWLPGFKRLVIHLQLANKVLVT